MRKQKTPSLNHKFFLSLLLTATITIFTITILASIIFYTRYFDLETTYSLHQLEYIANQFDSYLVSVNNYSKTLSVDDIVQDNVTTYNYNTADFNALNQFAITQQISKIIQTTPFIHSVRLYSHDKSTIATSERFPYNSTIKDFNLIEKPVWLSCKKYDNLRKQEIGVLSLIRPFYSYKTGNLLGYMEISIPESVISNIYRSQTTELNSIQIVNAKGIVQSATDPTQLGQKYPYMEKITIQSGNTSSFYTMENITFSSYFKKLDWYLIHEFNLQKFLQPAFTTFQITLLIAFACIFACSLFSHKIATSVTAPLYKLIEHTRKIKKENNWTPLENVHTEDCDISHLIAEYNSMIIAQEHLKNDLMESQKMKSKISLDLLQQQVSPHFLYNTLDNICSLAEIDEKDTLINIVMNLSSFYRGTLSNGKFHITVSEELNIIRSYLHIMQIRYYEKFDFYIHCDSNLLNYSCLKLLLQPIVENSIYHGIKELSYRGKIIIAVSENAQDLIFTITDNGRGITPYGLKQLWNPDADHFGIKNIHERVKLYYGNEYGLIIGNHDDGGCMVTIRIKKQEVF